ncbi:MAG: CHAP domain-containing protein, partial [Oscillospiraceae bacterium]|nr:CHAP domain-containing protein [Oscillospiraceae bacterium]
MTSVKAADFAQAHKKKSLWQKVMTVMACIAVFCVTYALILPAITREAGAFCGIEEHIHDEGCYEVRRVLICGTDGTTSEEPEAGVPQGAASSSEAEVPAETEAADVTETPVEAETPVETETPVEIETPVETEAPVETNAPAAHVHTDACYEEVSELVCDREEHSHTLQCFSDPEADVETAAVWEKTMAGVKLTGVWADDLIAIAQTQLGYRESTKNYVVRDGDELFGYTRYGAWAGMPYEDWCAMFVSFCMEYAGVDTSRITKQASCPRWVEILTERGMFYKTYNAELAALSEGQSSKSVLPADYEAYTPKPGDIIFFTFSDDGNPDHVGIVKELLSDSAGKVDRVRVIEGNSSDQVCTNVYALESKVILGYAPLPENPDAVYERVYRGKDYTVTATYTADAGLPSDAVLSVRELEPDTDEYNKYHRQTLTAVRRTYG